MHHENDLPMEKKKSFETRNNSIYSLSIILFYSTFESVHLDGDTKRVAAKSEEFGI